MKPLNDKWMLTETTGSVEDLMAGSSDMVMGIDLGTVGGDFSVSGWMEINPKPRGVLSVGRTYEDAGGELIDHYEPEFWTDAEGTINGY